jgi:porphobilinogen deaminase
MQAPLAGYGEFDSDTLELEGLVAELDGSVLIRDKLFGQKDKPEELGVHLANFASGGARSFRNFGNQR